MELSKHSELAPHVQHLRLAVPFYHLAKPTVQLWEEGEEEEEQRKSWVEERRAQQAALPGTEIRKLLREAMLASKLQNITCIELDAIVVHSPWYRRELKDVPMNEGRSVKTRSRHCYEALMLAVAASRLPRLRSLIIYKDLPACGIAADTVANCLEHMRTVRTADHFAAIAKNLDKFTITLSAPDDLYTSTRRGDLRVRVDGPNRAAQGNGQALVQPGFSNPAGILELLSWMPNLTRLDLAFQRTPTTVADDEFLPAVLERLKAPLLEQLSLVGFTTTAQAIEMLPFRFPELRRLVLWYISLNRGHWKSPLQTLRFRAPYLTKRGFDMEHEYDKCVAFTSSRRRRQTKERLRPIST